MSYDRFKFRVWDKKNSEYVPEGEMIDVHCLLHRDGTLDCGIAYDDGYARSIDWVETEDAVIEQCTGLQDKNGKLVYEGDVIQENGFNKYIYWNVTCWAYSMRKGHKNVAWELHKEDTENAEIIGNIHDDQFRQVTKLMETKPCQA